MSSLASCANVWLCPTKSHNSPTGSLGIGQVDQAGDAIGQLLAVDRVRAADTVDLGVIGRLLLLVGSEQLLVQLLAGPDTAVLDRNVGAGPQAAQANHLAGQVLDP